MAETEVSEVAIDKNTRNMITFERKREENDNHIHSVTDLANKWTQTRTRRRKKHIQNAIFTERKRWLMMRIWKDEKHNSIDTSGVHFCRCLFYFSLEAAKMCDEFAGLTEVSKRERRQDKTWQMQSQSEQCKTHQERETCNKTVYSR